MSKICVIGIVGRSVFLPVEKFHIGGETVEAKDVHFELGGKGFNQAVAAARCGARVSFIAASSEDTEGGVRDFLEKEGILPLIVKKQGPGAFAAIVTDDSGANQVTVYQGEQLTAEDVRGFKDTICSSDYLLLSNEVSEEVNEEAVRIAKESGVKVVLNPAPYRPLSDTVTSGVDLFTPNEHETEGLEGRPGVIITEGKRGAYVPSDNLRIPPASFGAAVDTTGAGDTFNGTLVAMLASGEDLYRAILIANGVAGLSVTRKYAVSSIPTSEEITAIINSTKENQKCKKD
jgi:ribokinase